MISDPSHIQRLMNQLSAQNETAMISIPEENESIFSEDVRTEHPLYERSLPENPKLEITSTSRTRFEEIVSDPQSLQSKKNPENTISRLDNQIGKDTLGEMSNGSVRDDLSPANLGRSTRNFGSTEKESPDLQTLSREAMRASRLSLTEMVLPKQDVPNTSQPYIFNFSNRARNSSVSYQEDSIDLESNKKEGSDRQISKVSTSKKTNDQFSKMKEIDFKESANSPKILTPELKKPEQNQKEFVRQETPVSSMALLESPNSKELTKLSNSNGVIHKSISKEKAKEDGESTTSNLQFRIKDMGDQSEVKGKNSPREVSSGGSLDEQTASKRRLPAVLESIRLKTKVTLAPSTRGSHKSTSAKQTIKSESKLADVLKSQGPSRNNLDKKEDSEQRNHQSRNISDFLASIGTKDNPFRKNKT